MNYDILLPDLGEGIESAEVSEILVSVGDEIKKEAPLLVLESDKASMEIPSDVSGVVKEVSVKKGQELVVGQLLVKVEPKGETLKQEIKTESKNYDILLPDLGEGIESAEVSEILVSVGDEIKKEAPLLVLESDKASMEIPSDVSGVVKEVSVKKGQELVVGQLLVKVEPKGEIPKQEIKIEKEIQEEVTTEKQTGNQTKKDGGKKQTDGVFASPGVRRLSRELEINLKNILPTGQKGRITKEDLHMFIKNKLNETGRANLKPPKKKTDYSTWGPIEEKPLTKIKKITGKKLQAAWNEIPQVTQFNKADITDLNNFRKSLNEENNGKGIKITFLPFLIKAVALLLPKYPHFNSSLDHNEESLIIKNYYHIGVAVDTEQGLVVPVIKDVNKKSLIELSEELSKISTKAREKKLLASEIKGGTFTISSLGGIGGSYFTPIVNSPEVAILGVSKSAWEQVYDEKTKEFIPRFVLPFSVSYDHRVIDGADGARFVRELSLVLENTDNFKE